VKDPTISKMTLQQKVLEQKEFSAMVQIFHFASMSTGVGVALHLLSFDSSVQKKKIELQIKNGRELGCGKKKIMHSCKQEECVT
jgi:hypothetical protein